MASKKSFWSRFRLVRRRSSPLLKCAILATIVLCTVALLTMRVAIRNMEQSATDLRNKAATLEQQNENLEKSIAELGTIQSVKRIAGEELGLVDPDSVFFEPVD